eukprot:scaffold51445_cov38-Cyclotella_meneghiniana.AAC.4
MGLSQEWRYLFLEDIPTHLSLICPGAFNETLIPGYWSHKAPNIRYWGTIDLKLKGGEADLSVKTMNFAGGCLLSFLAVQFDRPL